MQKRWIGLIGALLVSGAVLAGCGSSGQEPETAESNQTEVSAPAQESGVGSEASSGETNIGIIGGKDGPTAVYVGNETVEIDTSGPELHIGDQMDKPEKGDEIAVIKTTQGTIKMRLFPQAAPLAVANFKKLAQDGFYDGVSFHRIIDGFMIQTGQINATSIYGENFQDEFSDALFNLRGAVSMANSGPNTNGTQFFINQTPPSKFGGWDNILNGYRAYMQDPVTFTRNYGKWPDMSKVTMEIRDLYVAYGGNPSLDGAYTTTGEGHTVFGQVFEGMDVVDKIAAAETDENDRPVGDDYKIETITLEKYKG